MLAKSKNSVCAELRISDCSSDEENQAHSQPNNNITNSGEKDLMYISWSSEDEIGTQNCQSSLNRSFINQTATSPVIEKYYPTSARKSKLTSVRIKRKLSKDAAVTTEVRSALTTNSVPLKDKSNTTQSPWLKVRKTFAPLRCQRSLPTINKLSVTNTTNKTPTKNNSLSQKSDGTSIEWSSSSSESGSPLRATCGSIAATQKSTAPTELELLVALIERENAAPRAPTNNRSVKTKQKRRRLIEGGYAERLQKLEDANRIERNFLQHDQHLGLQNGTRMRVVELNQTYGVYLATVELETCNESVAIDDDADDGTATNIRIVIDTDMAANVRVGSKLEAFFDTHIKPYRIETDNGICKEEIYVQPHKLLLL